MYAAIALSVLTRFAQSNVLFYLTAGLLGLAFLAVSVEFGGSRFASSPVVDEWRSLLKFGPALAVFLAMTMTIPRVSDADRRAPVRYTIQQIGVALTGYDETFHRLPRHATTDADGKAQLSWRVQILLFAEQAPLYSKFKLTEAWDSPSNLPLIGGRTIPTFVGYYTDEPDKTPWQVFVGPGTAFDPAEKILRLNHHFPDGTANTLLVVEAPTLVPWSKPEDLRYHPDEPLPKFGREYHWLGPRPMLPAVSAKGFFAAMADGSARFLSVNVSEDVLRRVIVRNDGKPLAADWDK